MNSQPVSPLEQENGNVLDVHSIFHTIQGEGPFVGRPAVFIRLAGCNLQCPGCDTDYTDGRCFLEVPGIVRRARMLDTPNDNYMPLAVITGGEPFRQDITELLVALLDNGFHVQVETNGSAPPGAAFVAEFVEGTIPIVCSPKTAKIHPRLLPYITHFKYVLEADRIEPDGLPGSVLRHDVAPYVARPPIRFDPYRIFLQPMDSKDARHNVLNLQAAIKSCLEHGYTLGLQIHKIINME